MLSCRFRAVVQCFTAQAHSSLARVFQQRCLLWRAVDLHSKAAARALQQCRLVHNKDLRPYLEDLYQRQQLQGQETIPRHILPEWNYESELYAFGYRFVENWPADRLADIFAVNVDATRQLHKRGLEIASRYALAYLRCHYPAMPEESLLTIRDSFLLSEDSLSEIGANMGLRLLVPPDVLEQNSEKFVFQTVFLSLVGLTEEIGGTEQAEHLVLDFVLTRLCGSDPMYLWFVDDPVTLLYDYLGVKDQPEPEFRLMRSAGESTITPVYVVGVYVDRTLIAQSAGEDLATAEDMSAREALRVLFGANQQLKFGEAMKSMDLSDFGTKPNWSLAVLGKEWSAAVEGSTRASVLPDLPEVLQPQEMLIKYKTETEVPLGVPYRRRLRHKFWRGPRNRKSIRLQLMPKLDTL